jgi:serine/threonine-protein phosphatase CPPED1
MTLLKNPFFATISLLIWLTNFVYGQEDSSFKPFFFVQLTDPQFGMYESDKGFTKETELYEKAIAAVNRLRPEFVVITGDLVNNRNLRPQTDEFMRITSKINKEIPVFLIPGNHDIPVPATENEITKFVGNFGYDRFSFRKGKCLFIGINSSIIKSGESKLEEEQYEWLKTTLEADKDPVHIILFSHYPLFLKSSDEPDSYSNITSPLRKKYLDLLNKYNVEAVFSGHLHVNDSTGYLNTKMISTGAIGKPLGKDPSGLRIVKVMKNKTESAYYSPESIPDKILYIP